MGETKVRSALWVLTEGVAVGGATSAMGSVKKASIPLLAAISLVGMTASADRAVLTIMIGSAAAVVVALAAARVLLAAVVVAVAFAACLHKSWEPARAW